MGGFPHSRHCRRSTRNKVALLEQTRAERNKEMRATIYCRVSTEDRKQGGTSLQSQLEAGKNVAREGGYEVPEGLTFMEIYSGLSLDRPELTKLRDIVRDESIAAVITYTPDRLCRNGEDILTLVKEFKTHGAKLIFVEEQRDDTLSAGQ
jgi:site-specific DNA recombinase